MLNQENLKNLKLCFIDTETTSLDSEKGAIIEIGMILEWYENNEKKTEKYNWKVQPHKNSLVDARALKVNGTTLEEIESYPEASKVVEEFDKALKAHLSEGEKYFFLAYNANFDMSFVAKFLKNNGKHLTDYFNTPCVDIMQIALFNLLPERSSMENFKLSTVAKKLGVEFDENNLHSALTDIEIAKEVFEKSI